MYVYIGWYSRIPYDQPTGLDNTLLAPVTPFQPVPLPTPATGIANQPRDFYSLVRKFSRELDHPTCWFPAKLCGYIACIACYFFLVPPSSVL